MKTPGILFTQTIIALLMLTFTICGYCSDDSLVVSEDGKIGIGKEMPEESLDVNGNAIIHGTLSFKKESLVVRKGVLSFVHPEGGYPRGQEWAPRFYHIKTPDKKKNSDMYRYDLNGYSYGIGKAISFTWCGYLYSGDDNIRRGQSVDRINAIPVSQYIGSDDHLYLKFGPISQYYNSFILDYQGGETVGHANGGYRVILTENDVQL